MTRAGVAKGLLVVDNDEDLQRCWRELAAEVKYACVCASTLREASAALSCNQRLQPAWDLVVIEERLPDGSGTSLLSLLDGLLAKPIVVVVSGHLDASIGIKLLRCGVAAVSKPIAPPQMRELLELMDLRLRGGWPLEDKGLGYQLSQRELEVLRLSLSGLRQREIAERLGCSEGSIKTLSQRVCVKAGKQSLRDVVAHAISTMSSQFPNPTPRSSGVHSMRADRGSEGVSERNGLQSAAHGPASRK